MKPTSSRILITGACGFIGRGLARHLGGKGAEIVGVDLNCQQDGALARIILSDITRPGPWEKALEGIDAVFHLAGKAHALSENQQDEAEYFRINTDGTRHVLEAAQCHGIRRFVLFSTVKAMSRNDAEPAIGTAPPRAWDESDSTEPDTPYGRSKLAAENLVLHGGYVPEPVVLRLCMVYGAGAKGNLQQMLAAVSRRRFPPLPDVPNRRSMVHVEDVVEAAVLAFSRPEAVGGVFIVSDGRAYSTHEILDLMHRALGRTMPGWAVPVGVLKALGRVGDLVGRLRGRRFVFDSDALPKLLGSAWYSSEKMQDQLGFHPQWDLERALPSMIAAL